MDNITNIIAGVIALYFIAAMLMFFYWLYFHKGSLKKALIHIVVSLALLCLLVGGQMLRWKSINAQNAAEQAAKIPKAVTIQPDLLAILQANPDPASVEPAKLAAIANLAEQHLGEAGKEYEAPLKKYFVYYNSHIASEKLPDTMAAIKFDAQRRNAERGF